jgi:hypothetical protein
VGVLSVQLVVLGKTNRPGIDFGNFGGQWNSSSSVTVRGMSTARPGTCYDPSAAKPTSNCSLCHFLTTYPGTSNCDEQQPAKRCSYQHGVDYWGGDLLKPDGTEDHNVTAADYHECALLCKGTAACHMFTFDANEKWPCGDRCCWLKGKVDKTMAHESAGAVSGVCE